MQVIYMTSSNTVGNLGPTVSINCYKMTRIKPTISVLQGFRKNFQVTSGLLEVVSLGQILWNVAKTTIPARCLSSPLKTVMISSYYKILRLPQGLKYRQQNRSFWK